MTDAFDLRRSAAEFPHHVALRTDSGHCLSYNDVWHATETVAQWLLDHGVSPGTAWVAIEARKDCSSVLTVWTLISLGIPFVLLHPSWSEVQKAAAVEQTGALLVPLPVLQAPPPSAAPHVCYERLARAVQAETPLCVVYTSGTTGVPKGVILSRRAFLASGREAQCWLQLQDNDRWLLNLPLAHVGGLSILTRTWLTHSSVVLPPTNPSSFDPVLFVERCNRSQATLVSLVPTQMQRLCAAGLHAPHTLRCVLLGGAATAPSLAVQAQALGYRVLRTYGLTELCSLVATEKLDQQKFSLATASAPLPTHAHVDAQLNSEGRLMLRGQALYSGYWGQDPITPTDWFTTEDLAELVDNDVQILGRADDVIVTGGEKVHPAQVESALLTCSSVEQACVFARASDEWGQELCAALVTTPSFAISNVVSHLRQCLPSFNIPRAWVVVTQLPTSPNGKFNRRHIAAHFGPLCQPI